MKSRHKPNLKRDLEETISFFDNENNFCRELEFITMSNSYVRILDEAIKKMSFPGYNVYTGINQIINCEIKNNFSEKTRREYKLTVSFDKL